MLQPRLRMAASNGLGMIYAVTLCLVIVITNVHMRGLWSVIASWRSPRHVLFAVLGWWDPILRASGSSTSTSTPSATSRSRSSCSRSGC